MECKINAAKLAFLLPFFEQFFKKCPERFDIDLRIRVAKFLQSAVNSKFIKVNKNFIIFMLRDYLVF